MSTVTVLTQGEVEQEILRISDDMEGALRELAQYAEAAAHAEAEYKIEYAKAYLEAATGDGFGPKGRVTEGEKESKALGKTEYLLRARLVSDAQHEVAVEKLRTMRSQLDALRTVSANIRAQT